jgi:carbon-monoxide dehydrogenase medium subunit
MISRKRMHRAHRIGLETSASLRKSLEGGRLGAISSVELTMARSLDEAVAALTDLGPEGAPLAGGTWVMREPTRGVQHRRSYVGIGRIPELSVIEVSTDKIRIGACATHADLVAGLSDVRSCHGLVSGAGKAANPSIRQMATLGGGLCCVDFAASDLLAALLCLGASVDLRSSSGTEQVSIGRFIEARGNFEPGVLLVAATVARERRVRTGHARLPLRKAGDYPVAIVSMAVELRDDGTIEDIRIAVGSVETVPKRWSRLEQSLIGWPLRPDEVRERALDHLDVFEPRDSVEAPAWYRVQVLPALARRAAQAVLDTP